jgi:hypothetical protein
MEVSRIDRTVVIVAQGELSHDDIRKVTQDLIDANVAAFGKIIDSSAAKSNLSKDQVAEIAAMLRTGPGSEARGPVAYVINPDRVGFAHSFAEASKSDRPIKLFISLHEARRWPDAAGSQAAACRPGRRRGVGRGPQPPAPGRRAAAEDWHQGRVRRGQETGVSGPLHAFQRRSSFRATCTKPPQATSTRRKT